MKIRSPRCSFHHSSVMRSGSTAGKLTGNGDGAAAQRRSSPNCGSRRDVHVDAAVARGLRVRGDTQSRSAMPSSRAASRASSNATPGCGSRSMRSSSAWSGSSACAGHTWKPRHPRFTAQMTCARSAITSASEVVPFGVLTIVGLEPVGPGFGYPLLEEGRAGRAVRKALHEDRAIPHRAEQRHLDHAVVADEVELRLAPLGEPDLVGARDAYDASGDLDLDAFVLLRHTAKR